MGFYTPTWINKLVKEESQSISALVNKKGNDFREYIDTRTPFVLWLDIDLIRDRILNHVDAFITDLAAAVDDGNAPPDLPQKIKQLLDDAYVRTINSYANNSRYQKIDQHELESLLTELNAASVGEIRNVITKNFSRTKIITNVTKPDKSVMLLLPSFSTLEFGPTYRKILQELVEEATWLEASPAKVDAGMFSALAMGNTGGLSQKDRLLAFVTKNFAALQNIGHIEVDVVSEKEKIVKRGQNSPRLLQALLSLPKESNPQRLQLKFSKETGQAQTRLKIRKKFSGSKLVFELLVENGISVGLPETQKVNLAKAALERAFSVGKGFTSVIRKNPSILTQFESSKSLLQYIEGTIVSAIKTGKQLPAYTSNFETVSKSSFTIYKPKIQFTVKLSNKILSTPKKLKVVVKKPGLNLVNLENLINQSLTERIKQNMGTGNRRDVLNLRSGRFAESVKVERMSQSREGMITAFYSYMKNPYATFSQGGRQDAPKSRDPKLLIARSIREIAAQQVANRLRSVSI
jgi:hypothetical protein